MGRLSFNVHETIDPAAQVDEAVVSILNNPTNLIPAARYNLGTQFFNKIGRKLRIRAFGKFTSGAGGNCNFAIMFGTGANNNGVNVAQSIATNFVAATDASWEVEAYIHCRSLGATGTLFATGRFHANTAWIASTAQPMLIPDSAAVVSAACDLTGTLIPALQFRAGGGPTMTVQDYDITPMS